MLCLLAEDLPAAERLADLEEAARLNPLGTYVHLLQAEALTALDRGEEALTEAERCRELFELELAAFPAAHFQWYDILAAQIRALARCGSRPRAREVYRELVHEGQAAKARARLLGELPWLAD